MLFLISIEKPVSQYRVMLILFEITSSSTPLIYNIFYIFNGVYIFFDIKCTFIMNSLCWWHKYMHAHFLICSIYF